jgi:glycosyltransferase involved in cell wall biosynthesis
VIGGSERYTQEIARRQVLDGHRVTVVATDAVDLQALWDRGGRRIGPGVADERQGVRIKRLPVQHLPLGTCTFPAIRWLTWLVSQFSGRAALSLARFSPWVPRLRQVLIEESADLLFAWNITLEGLTKAVAREAQRRRVPWVAVPLLHLGRSRLYTMPHQLDLLRGARVILAQTPVERAFLLKGGLAADRVHVIGPGVDPAEAARSDGQRFRRKYGLHGPLVLSLGALGYDKGTFHLLAAAQRMWDEGRRVTVALVGPEQGGVRRTLTRLPERYRAFCRYLGEVPEADKWDAVAATDVVVMPSRTESFGIVFLEAWACGRPVIGARAGAVCDVIRDGVDGMLVEFGDVAGLAEALGKLLDNPALADEMGRRGREKVLRAYTWDRQYAQLRAVVDGLGVEWDR